ncbi:VOC family protein [Marivirga salinae]|uniref:VOC family protein n=1 Tax=Marivirga salinarum TaxID=3059078 RepID=A0AA49GE90_9BACT|nr:VOC family protein [Marivirga sp. BDSF4-3]WKK77060.2 VOC family protein [Marivirga sp. BDSF4-3]
MKTTLLLIAFNLVLFTKTNGQIISNNSLGIDHIFIWCKDHSKVKQLFESNGFVTHQGKPHKGQGTAGSYILVGNMYIELISVENQQEFNENNIQHNLKSMSLKPDWKTNKASPFGIGLHLLSKDTSQQEFESFIYQQDWMEDSTYYMMSKSIYTHFLEPAIFIVPNHKKFKPERFTHLLNHPNGIKEATSIMIKSRNTNDRSEAMTTLNNFDAFHFKMGKEELMTITFDNFKTGTTVDFRPEMPLIIKY